MQSRFCFCAILGSPLLWHLVVCPATAQQTAADRLELRGKVVNSVTGEPVAGALVQISSPGQNARFSGAGGTFVFADLPPGSYVPVARKPGFFNDQELNTWRPATPLSPTGQGEQAILKLTPEAIIYGEIKNENGEPLEGVVVRGQRWEVQNGQRQLETLGDATTDDEGKFRLADLRPGRYYLSFPSANNGGWSATYRLSSKKQEEQGYGGQFYPGVPDLESATVIEIRAGAHVHIAQTLTRQRLYEVSGVVRGGDPESGFNLWLMNSAGDTVQRNVRINPKTGQFQILGVPAGTYLLRANANLRPVANIANGPGTADQDPPQPLTATLPLHVQGDVSGLVVVLGSGTSIGVQVRDEISDNSGGNNPHPVSLQMIPLKFPTSSSWIRVPPTPGDRRAPTRFEGLAPDTYTVSAMPNGPWYVSSLRSGSENLLRDDLTISPGATPPPIEVTLRDDGAQLTVKVMENGQPAVAGVLLFSREYPRRSQFFGSLSSISTGSLAPGTYYVIAMRGAENLEFHNPTAMERYLNHATEVTLGPRADVTVIAEVQSQEEQVP